MVLKGILVYLYLYLTRLPTNLGAYKEASKLYFFSVCFSLSCTLLRKETIIKSEGFLYLLHDVIVR